MIRYAVIGAAGYIGRHLVAALESRGHTVHKFFHESGPTQNLASHEFVCDLRNFDGLDSLDWDFDVVFFLAGLSGTADSIMRYKDYIEVNEVGLLNFLQVLKNNDQKPLVVYPSTRLVYEGQESQRQNESAPKLPKTVYAMTKLAAESYLAMASNLSDIHYQILRVGVVYGSAFKDANYSYGTVSFFISRAENGEDIPIYGDGEQLRTVTHVEDICEQLLMIAETKSDPNQVYNAVGESLSVREIAGLVAEPYGVGVSSRSWPETALKLESGDTVFDSEKLLQMALRDGIDYSLDHEFESWIEGVRVMDEH